MFRGGLYIHTRNGQKERPELEQQFVCITQTVVPFGNRIRNTC